MLLRKTKIVQISLDGLYLDGLYLDRLYLDGLYLDGLYLNNLEKFFTELVQPVSLCHEVSKS